VKKQKRTLEANALVDALSGAIARREGFYVPNSKAQRNHNPGNIRPWPDCKLPTAGGMILFPDDAAGFKQLKAQIYKNIERGLTLYEFFGGRPGVYAGYAPAADHNDPKSYAEFVARLVGIPADVQISEAIASREFAKA
jgi:hypothetical protein